MSLLVDVLRTPERARAMSPGEWQRLLAQADSAGLVGRLDALFRARGVAPPAYAAWHFVAARRVAERHRQQVTRELRGLASLLHWLEVPGVLLKGAAYLALELPVA